MPDHGTWAVVVSREAVGLQKFETLQEITVTDPTIGGQTKRLHAQYERGTLPYFAHTLLAELDEGANLSLPLAETSTFHSCSSNSLEKDTMSPVFPCPSSSPYYSPRIQLLKESRGEFATDLDFDIHASRGTWTEGTLQEEDQHEFVREENRKAFEELKKHPNFNLYELKIDEGHLIGVGGEAEIYAAAGTVWKQIRTRELLATQDGGDHFCLGRGCPRCGRRREYERFVNSRARVEQKLVVKVFKEGFLLSNLLKNWSPRWMAETDSTKNVDGYNKTVDGFHKAGGALNLCWAVGAQVLNDSKFRGRFAFLLPRYDCDLRKVIDERKMGSQNDGPPFERDHTLLIVCRLAKAMAGLHELELLHRDLKAANVLCNCKDGLVDELSIADFESPVGVIGTRFWRAPEILMAVKSRVWAPHPVTRAADVYSFAMTCYEVITGLIPLEDLPQNKYDEVIAGRRPELPDNLCPELNNLVRRCWHSEPLQRPSFKEIVCLVEEIMRYYKDYDLLTLYYSPDYCSRI